MLGLGYVQTFFNSKFDVHPKFSFTKLKSY